MSENPLEPGEAELPPAKLTRPTRWLIWSGVVSLLAAAACFVITVANTFMAADAIATSTATPKPSDLARDISRTYDLSIAAVAFVAVGVILIVAGLVIRRPVD